MTLIYSALAGGDCIDDADAMRVAATPQVLGHGVRAPSTLGTFLRSFTWGHVSQADRVLDELICRAWASGAGPETGPVTLDVDSTICETYGFARQGARLGHTKVRGSTRCSRRRPAPTTWWVCAFVAATLTPAGGRRLSHPGLQPCAPGGCVGADGASGGLRLLQPQRHRGLPKGRRELLHHREALKGLHKVIAAIEEND